MMRGAASEASKASQLGLGASHKVAPGGHHRAAPARPHGGGFAPTSVGCRPSLLSLAPQNAPSVGISLAGRCLARTPSAQQGTSQ